MAADEAPEKGGNKKKLMIGGGGVVVLAIVGFLFLGGGGGDPEAADTTTTTVVMEGAVIESDEMTVNLADESVRYARIKVGLVLPVDGDSTTVGERMPILKDSILGVLGRYDAATLLEPDTLDELRQRFTDEANEVWTEGEVLRVVITELLVQ